MIGYMSYFAFEAMRWVDWVVEFTWPPDELAGHVAPHLSRSRKFDLLCWIYVSDDFLKGGPQVGCQGEKPSST